MKLKYDVLNQAAISSLNKLMASDKLPILVAWDLFDVVKVCKEQHAKLVEMNNAIVKKHGKDGKVELVKLTQEQRDAFDADFKSVGEKEFEVSLKEKIKLPKDIEGLSVQDLFSLEWLITR